MHRKITLSGVREVWEHVWLLSSKSVICHLQFLTKLCLFVEFLNNNKDGDYCYNSFIWFLMFEIGFHSLKAHSFCDIVNNMKSSNILWCHYLTGVQQLLINITLFSPITVLCGTAKVPLNISWKSHIQTQCENYQEILWFE